MTETNRSIRLGQLGFHPGEHKMAVFLQGEEGGAFVVEDAASGKVVFRGKLRGPIQSEASGEQLYQAVFSELDQPGTYRMKGSQGEASAVFAIGEEVFHDAHQAMLKAFYYLRCGMELEEKHAAPWTHKACHLTPAIVYGQEDRRIDVCGGWHDAGDFGKYVGPGAKAVADLLLAYEDAPQAFAAPVHIPESGSGVPDVLSECRYELEWMLKMQDTETDGVFHKVTTLKFPSFSCMPEDDLADLYLSPISAAATGCFAGVMAMAARVYKPVDPAFAKRCLDAAIRAWGWLVRNPEVPGFKNPPEIKTGEYGDSNDRDERFWAAAELYRTTGESEYHAAFRKLAEEANFYLYRLGWADMGGYGVLAYLRLPAAQQDAALAGKLKQGWIAQADDFLKRSEQDGYGISLLPSHYIWGSNMLVMNHAMTLLIAHQWTGKEAYRACAYNHLQYIFGCNPVDLSYVTGVGSRYFMEPHYRPGIGDGIKEPVPGMVSGGPNKGLQDEVAKKELSGQPPAKCFLDHSESYSTNEITIYWNSPTVYVTAQFTKSRVAAHA
ncbi:glycoside hydrolase [Xylanibacillus composti]|uniref:Endoglucanase n=1 Tax=Xylanibacillus composti TaxID=1572762 RepID=A0A8J4M3A6_9BACL|nr:glycoside hydrolase family 9 protein [Xylanibacillus composti]MDT9724742.1 glycoside hydrolase [Xylanibacillus composti]GIQ69905.1 endoglucanase [Xylanibacillus composti]